MELKLKHPLTIGTNGKIIETLTFRDYTTAGDYLAFDIRGGVAQTQQLIANLSGTDISIIQRLRGVDYRRAGKIVDDLIDADEKEEAETTEAAKGKK
jgi:hypothetical protein